MASAARTAEAFTAAGVSGGTLRMENSEAQPLSAATPHGDEQMRRARLSSCTSLPSPRQHVEHVGDLLFLAEGAEVAAVVVDHDPLAQR